jgi:peptidoglycan/LPS O-acetylase OafA/YrhL
VVAQQVHSLPRHSLVVSRYRSLDGLRGAAALVVVVHHCLLTSVVLAATYRGGTTTGWGLTEILTRTPLHLLWDGTGAVLVFFVLSGFVLTLAFTKPAPPRWANYYARRFPRLYLPVWAALAVAVGLALLVPRLVATDQSWWINAHAAHPTLSMAAKDATLVTNPSLLDSPLWSLRWEVAFSALLPLYIWFAVKWRGFATVKIVAALVIIGVGSETGHASLLYLPVFALGAVLAAERTRVAALTALCSTRAWVAVSLAAVALMTVDSMMGSLPEWTTRPLRSAGAALIVVIFLGWRPVSTFASRRWLQWLGGISFSLYLVHEPIVVTAARLLPGRSPFLILLLVLPVSLLLAAIFHRLVEVPSLQISRWLGKAEERPSQFWATGSAASDQLGAPRVGQRT